MMPEATTRHPPANPAGQLPGNGHGLTLTVAQTLPMPLQGSLVCQAGQLLALVGPSGAGKTSVLRVLAGLMQPATGRVVVGGQVWFDRATGVNLSPQQRHVGLVFQHYALMPHLSALDNVALALLHLPQPQRHQVARQWLQRVQLAGDLLLRRPAQLSGGQQQRVAVARALAREPRLLLLDEPFSAVDQLSRKGLYSLLADLRKDLSIPIVLVTHDLAEARMLADTLVVMDGGHVLQQGTPEHLYRAPRNARVADLVGIQNRFLGRWAGPAEQPGMGWLEWLPETDGTDNSTGPTPDGARAAADGTPTPPPRLCVVDKGRLAPGQRVTWVIQGDGLQVWPPPTQADQPDVWCACLTALRHLGDLSLATLELVRLPGVHLHMTLAGPQRLEWSVGQTVCIKLDPAWVHVMPTRTA